MRGVCGVNFYVLIMILIKLVSLSSRKANFFSRVTRYIPKPFLFLCPFERNRKAMMDICEPQADY